MRDGDARQLRRPRPVSVLLDWDLRVAATQRRVEFRKQTGETADAPARAAGARADTPIEGGDDPQSIVTQSSNESVALAMSHGREAADAEVRVGADTEVGSPDVRVLVAAATLLEHLLTGSPTRLRQRGGLVEVGQPGHRTRAGTGVSQVVVDPTPADDGVGIGVEQPNRQARTATPTARICTWRGRR